MPQMLEKDPSTDDSAQEVAEEIGRFLAGEPFARALEAAERAGGPKTCGLMGQLIMTLVGGRCGDSLRCESSNH